MSPALQLEIEADRLLRAAGNGDLCLDWAMDRKVQLDQGYAVPKKAPDRAYEPSGAALAKNKTVGRPCPGCGSPMSKFAGANSKCRACYRAKAVAKHAGYVANKYQRIEEMAGRMNGADVFVNAETSFGADGERYVLTADFSHVVVEEISSIEQQIKLPAAFWPRGFRIF